MKKFLKRLLTAACVFTLASSVLAGCSGSVNPDDYGTTVVATLGDEQIYLDEANYYLRSEQYYYEMMYSYMYGTSDIWDMEVSSGVTMEDSLKEAVMTVLRQTYILCDHAEELGVSLSDEDIAKVEETADNNLSQVDENLLSALNLTRDRMIAILEKNALANRVWEAVVAAADTDISDEEARCVGASYVLVSDSTSSSEEETQAETQADGEETTSPSPKAVAQTIYDDVRNGSTLSDAAENQGLTAATVTYYTGDTFDEGSLGAHALSMAEGDVELFHVDGSGWYVMYLDAEMDEDATESQRQTMISEAQAAVFEETYSQWQTDSAEFTVDDDIWNAVPMDTLYVAETVAETESGAETTAAGTESAEETEAGTEGSAAETAEETVGETAEETSAQAETAAETTAAQ